MIRNNHTAYLKIWEAINFFDIIQNPDNPSAPNSGIDTKHLENESSFGLPLSLTLKAYMRKNKLGLNWAKLTSNWNWTLLQLLLHYIDGS